MLPMLCVLYYYAYIRVLCIILVTAECSVDELFIHYFYCLPSASAGFDPRLSTGAPSPRTLLGYFRSQAPNLLTMEKC